MSNDNTSRRDRAQTGANLGFEKILWESANKLRGRSSRPNTNMFDFQANFGVSA